MRRRTDCCDMEPSLVQGPVSECAADRRLPTCGRDAFADTSWEEREVQGTSVVRGCKHPGRVSRAKLCTRTAGLPNQKVSPDPAQRVLAVPNCRVLSQPPDFGSVASSSCVALRKNLPWPARMLGLCEVLGFSSGCGWVQAQNLSSYASFKYGFVLWLGFVVWVRGPSFSLESRAPPANADTLPKVNIRCLAHIAIVV